MQLIFHAQFRRSNPNINSDHVLVDGIKGKGHTLVHILLGK